MQYVYTREPEKRDPPPKRATALAFIQSEIDHNRGFPTLQMIAAHMGWKNTSSAQNCLEGLVADGHVKRTRNARGYRWELVP